MKEFNKNEDKSFLFWLTVKIKMNTNYFVFECVFFRGFWVWLRWKTGKLTIIRVPRVSESWKRDFESFDSRNYFVFEWLFFGGLMWEWGNWRGDWHRFAFRVFSRGKNSWDCLEAKKRKTKQFRWENLSFFVPLA